MDFYEVLDQVVALLRAVYPKPADNSDRSKTR
jgi:hypothetical protein